MRTPVRAVDGKRAFRRTDVCAVGIRRSAHGRSARTVRCVSESNGRAGTTTDAEDCRRWATADHGFLPLPRHAGAPSSARCTMDVRPVGAESQAPANRFLWDRRESRQTSGSRRACRLGRKLRSSATLGRHLRPMSSAVRRDSRRSHKKRFAGCRERQDVACGVRRATAYFNSTRSMRNANAPSGCPAVNAMARTRARSAPLKPFSGTRISFHSGPASKVCMLGICCEPWNSIS